MDKPEDAFTPDSGESFQLLCGEILQEVPGAAAELDDDEIPVLVRAIFPAAMEEL